MKYEYRIMEGNALPSAENLNSLGQEGWELVQIIPSNETFYIYLKRPKTLH